MRQLINGAMDLPCGILADSLARHRAPLLASALLSMGVGLLSHGSPSVFAWVLIGCGLIGLGTALWHPAAAAALSNNFPERRATALPIPRHGSDNQRHPHSARRWVSFGNRFVEQFFGRATGAGFDNRAPGSGLV